ncbi:MAG TPA: SDR family NAD(P)-dependent oxidoreductase [Aggregatilineales bacterium]|nr:SDR family NAD(P)-dependent oxidoreductase [Aggregatilineales bacterium]HPV06716.1 SDR family NAD(P)-dependent oxidoreductase [Aggregatilineales bacterium]HQA68156.1 SDR family NAD(P)-dependent oxidoreductase [Aggregatilineales bacterium]HQE17160.1 SDR family NAD(P)-dependent oxidoreductase [Aggregatilineales bacterium]
MTHSTQFPDGVSAIVTGGGRGIGAALARALGAAGVRVCVNDLNPDRAEQVAAAIVEAGGEAFAWQGDVANKFQLAGMIETTRDRYGSHLHLLVHNAHVSPRQPALKMDEWDLRRTVEVNLIGAYLAAQLAARVMADEGGGLIALLTREPGEGGAAFAATQGALGALAAALDAEVRAQGVRVQAVPVGTEAETVERVLALAREAIGGLAG